MSEKAPIMAEVPICISRDDREIIIDALAGEAVDREEYITNFDPKTQPVMYGEAVENYNRAEEILRYFKGLSVCD